MFGIFGDLRVTCKRDWNSRNAWATGSPQVHVPKDRFTAICALAVGYRGTDEDIHPRMVKNNFANDRKELSEIAFKEQFQS